MQRFAFCFVFVLLGSLMVQAAEKKAEKAVEKSTEIPAAAAMQLFTYELKGKKLEIKAKLVDDLLVSDKCFSGVASKCRVFESLNTKPAKIKLKEGIVHPAGELCLSLDGKYISALDVKKQAVGFCEFTDGSMVEVWSYHSKRNPRVEIK